MSQLENMLCSIHVMFIREQDELIGEQAKQCTTT